MGKAGGDKGVPGGEYQASREEQVLIRNSNFGFYHCLFGSLLRLRPRPCPMERILSSPTLFQFITSYGTTSKTLLKTRKMTPISALPRKKLCKNSATTIPVPTIRLRTLLPQVSAFVPLPSFYIEKPLQFNYIVNAWIVLDPTIKLDYYREHDWEPRFLQLARSTITKIYVNTYAKTEMQPSSSLPTTPSEPSEYKSNAVTGQFYKKRRVEPQSELRKFLESLVAPQGVDILTWWKARYIKHDLDYRNERLQVNTVNNLLGPRTEVFQTIQDGPGLPRHSRYHNLRLFSFRQYLVY